MHWTVLLVEDNVGDALLTQRALTSGQDCTVVHVEGLDQAIAELRTRTFDVVLLDLKLPGSVGLETIEALLPHRPPPIIALTGMDTQGLGVAALRGGAQDFLTKRGADGPTMWRSIIHGVERASLQAAHNALFEKAEAVMAVICDAEVVLANPAGRALGLLAGQPEPEWARGRPDERTMSEDGVLRVLELVWHETSWRGQPAQLLQGRDVSDLRAQQRKFREQDQRLQEVERLHALARVSGGVAHRINNLLVTIRGNAQLLEEPGSSRESVDSILQAAGEMAGVVQHMLAFAGEQPLSDGVPSLNDAVQRVPVHAHLGEDVVVQLEMDPDAGGVPLGSAQIAQVLVALASNSEAAMGGVGRFRLSTLRRGDEVEWVVEDDGCGMDPGTLERALDPFFSTDLGHSGLGLSAVHGMVTRAGGRLQVRSKQGEGTSVSIFLPRAEPPEELVETAPGHGGVVLVVEDDRLVLRTISRCFRRDDDITLITAKDGVEALELAAAHHIDVLLTDMRMPRMGGAELYSFLARKRPGLPVVFVSGYTEVGLPDEAEGPHSAFLPKPFQLDELRSVIRRMLALAAARSS